MKRSQQYFKLLQTDDTLVDKITQAYLHATADGKSDSQSRTEVQAETSDLVNLILADYQLRVNQKPQVRESLGKNDLKSTIGDIFSDTSLAERLEPLTKLLMTKNDRVAKQVVKSIQRCLL